VHFDLLRGARLFAPEELGACDVLVGAGQVLWMGSGAPELRTPSGLEIREHDLSGKTLIPGLIDGHAHVTGGGGESGFASRVPPLALSNFTTAGVTSVVGLLGTDDTVRTTGDLVATTRGLRELGLSAWCYTGGYHLPATTLTGSVRGDIVHLEPVIGVGELAVSDHRSSQPTLDELLRVAADAHVAGLMTNKAGICHLHLGDGERGLDLVRRALETSELPAQVFHPTHVNRRRGLFEEALELAERGVVVDVTAFPAEDGEDAWSAAEAVRRFASSGLSPERLTVSSDGGGCLPVFDAEGRIASMGVGSPAELTATLRDLIEGGMDPATALVPFTSNPARVLRLAGKGHISVGAHADLVVLDAQWRVTDVMALGKWHVTGGEVAHRGPFEIPHAASREL
jgi:beta-aspartyl-dipeptidase (metallo-type)